MALKDDFLFQVKDICNELDVRSLCHKILQNVSMLLHADRGSLFLVQGDRSRCISSTTSTPPHTMSEFRTRCLVSKLFDVCSRSTLKEMEKKEEIKIPWGMGIVGFVAESGEPVNIPDAYKVCGFFSCDASGWFACVAFCCGKVSIDVTRRLFGIEFSFSSYYSLVKKFRKVYAN